MVAEQPQISSAHQPPTHRQTRRSLVGAALLLVGLAVVIPFAGLPLPKVSGYIVALDAVLFVTDLITAGLVLAHFSVTRSRALLVLACGYFFSAAAVVAHGVTFPEALYPFDAPGESIRINFRIYLLWHLGIAVGAFAYIWLRDIDLRRVGPHSTTDILAAVIGMAVLFLAATVVYLVLLPPLTPEEGRWLTALTMLICAAALLTLWVRRRTAIDQWLMVVVLAMIVELTITALLGYRRAGSATLGFYAGRLFSLVTSTVVLASLLAETTKLYTAVARGNLLQLTVDTIPALAWSARTDGTADFFNRYYLEYVGKTPEELSGWAWTEAIHPDDIPLLQAAWAKARDNGGGTECEARMRGANGAYRWFIFRANPLRDEGGNVVKWYGINTDIEDRKLAEAELRRSESSLADAQRISALGSFSWYIDKGKIEFSDELYRVFEFDRLTPVTIERIAERVHPNDIALLTEKVRLATDGIDDHDYDIRARMPDGRTKHLRTASRSAVEADGTRVFRGSIQDVTSQKLAEEALNELRAELAHVSRVSTLGAMAASIAHEVNQPLSGIITNASTSLRMLAKDPPNIEGARETARRTIRDGNRAAEVVTRLRAMFRKRSETTDAVDLNEAARDVIALASSELRRSRVELEISLAAELPPVAGDRVQLQQVILNLLLNAADAVADVEGRPRRTILRTNKDEDGNVILSIEDTGVGIDPESSVKLFDAFYTTKANGMGIGLSISRSIIEHHGGRIWASANSNGPGASFSFSLPPPQSRSETVEAADMDHASYGEATD